VDHVVGGHQTVIKNLGTLYRDVEGLSGATILGDGTVRSSSMCRGSFSLPSRRKLRYAGQGVIMR